jgi:serine/threonine-protein kinase
MQLGTRIAQYIVVSHLGEGGMGTVYRATDTRLNRDVALKMLPAAFVGDAERLARFTREAHVLASLNHPNVAQIYDSGTAPVMQNGSSTDVAYLVMELVPGHTLAQIIDEGPIAPDVAVVIARQIAEALEAAHEQGIIHRDLKPANIKRRDDDVVKVLDFGLARAMDSAGPTDNALTMSSPTMLSPAMTQQGVILGTAGYMSPEQARGRPADKRADIWAFGVVVYEMLTGRPLFPGETVTEIIASVIKDPPSLSALPASTPPALRELLARCLERDPKLRLRDIGEARIALNRAFDAPARAPVPPAAARSSMLARVLVGAGALVLAGIAALAAWRAKPDAAPVPLRRFTLPALMAEALAAISPDGSRIASVTNGHLYVHSLSTGRTADLGAVSKGLSGLFWSPDSQTIAYGVDATLRTVPAGGGVPFSVCKVPASGRVFAGTWLDDGTILMAVWRDSLYSVPATGGTPAVRVAIDPQTDIDFQSVTAAPGNRLIVTTHRRGQDRERVEIIDGDRRTPITTDTDVESFQFRPPNYLLFHRMVTNSGIWAVPFDGGTIDLTKATLIEPGASRFDASREGTLIATVEAPDRRELTWLTATGAVAPVPGAPFDLAGPQLNLSPDGGRILIEVRRADHPSDYVVRDLATGTDTRVPLPSARSSGIRTGAAVTWRSTNRLLFGIGGVEQVKIFDWPADGTASGRELVTGLKALATPDGKELIFNNDIRSRARLFHAPVQPDGSIGPVAPVFPGDDDPDARDFDLSPDGHLLAFTASDATSRQLNVFIVSYPDLQERRQVTSDGGTFPKFSRDGRTLFFASGGRTTENIARGSLKAVAITPRPLGVGMPKDVMVEGEGLAAGDRALRALPFDIAPDGRLIVTRRVPVGPDDDARMVLTQNWFAAIKK